MISYNVSALLDRAIRHRACALKDTAYALISAELDPEFDKLCEDIVKARERRGKWMKMNVLFLVCILDSNLHQVLISFTRCCMSHYKLLILW